MAPGLDLSHGSLVGGRASPLTEKVSTRRSYPNIRNQTLVRVQHLNEIIELVDS